MTITSSAQVHRLEVIETLAEVADLAIKAFEHKDDSSHHELEKELCHQRSENERLRAELDKFYKTVQLHTFCGNNCQDIIVSGSSQQDNCPSDLYEQIRNTVDSPSFLAKLDTLSENRRVAADDSRIVEVEGDIMMNTNLEDPSWWLWVTDDMVPSNVEEKCGLDNEAYIVVMEEDIVDAIVIYIANCFFSDPRAKKMKPEQLQTVLSDAFESMHRRNRINKLWNAGKFMYTATTWGITAVGCYRHPFILRAAAKMLLASGGILIRAV